jgi:hypothetical protein
MQMVDIRVQAPNPGAWGQSVRKQSQSVNRKIDREDSCSGFCDQGREATVTAGKF